jgi:hypothetical protein
VAAICQRLEGIPLAVELAAARVKALMPEQIAARLDDCFQLLTGGSRTAPTRQQTLRATLDWSYDLLAEDEQTLFRRLAAFAGGFTLEAAQVIADLGLQTLDLLARLVDKSLVLAEEGGGEMRYRLLEPVRQYAHDRMRAAGESDAMRRRHADYYLALAEATEPKLHGAHQLAALAQLEREHDNFRAALAWSREHSTETEAAALGLRLTGALGEFWYFQNHYSEGRDWLTAATAQSERLGLTTPRAKALAVAGWLATSQTDYASACNQFEESIRLAREVNDKWTLAFSQLHLGITNWLHSNYTVACDRIEESLVLFRELGDPWGIANALCHLGIVYSTLGRHERSVTLLETALTRFREQQYHHGVALCCMNLGSGMVWQGDLTRATAIYEEAWALHQQLGNAWGAAMNLLALSRLARRHDDLESAMARCDEALKLFQHIGNTWGLALTQYELAAIAQAHGDDAQAATLLTQSLQLHWDIGSKDGVIQALESLAGLAARQDQPERAAKLGGASAALREIIGVSPLSAYEAAQLEQSLTPAREALGEAAFASGWEAGCALTMEQAVEYALS